MTWSILLAHHNTSIFKNKDAALLLSWIESTGQTTKEKLSSDLGLNATNLDILLKELYDDRFIYYLDNFILTSLAGKRVIDRIGIENDIIKQMIKTLSVNETEEQTLSDICTNYRNKAYYNYLLTTTKLNMWDDLITHAYKSKEISNDYKHWGKIAILLTDLKNINYHDSSIIDNNYITKILITENYSKFIKLKIEYNHSENFKEAIQWYYHYNISNFIELEDKGLKHPLSLFVVFNGVTDYLNHNKDITSNIYGELLQNIVHYDMEKFYKTIKGRNAIKALTKLFVKWKKDTNSHVTQKKYDTAELFNSIFTCVSLDDYSNINNIDIDSVKHLFEQLRDKCDYLLAVKNEKGTKI